MNIQHVAESVRSFNTDKNVPEQQLTQLILQEQNVLNREIIPENEEDKIYAFAESVIGQTQGKSLNNLQKVIFKRACEDKTYEEIAEETNCSEGHIKDVAADLWKQLSETLGEKVGKKNFKAVLERKIDTGASLYNNPKHRLQNSDSPKKYLGNIPDTNAFCGRKDELFTLERWIIEDHCRLITLLGMGGIGKSTLAAKLTKQVQDRFDFVIWRSLINVSSGTDILSNLLNFFHCPERMVASMSLEEKLLSLIEFFRNHRCLVILDNAESILQVGENNELLQQQYSLYQQLIKYIGITEHQSCLILTSQQKFKVLDIQEGEHLPVRSLQLKGLPLKCIQAILNEIAPFSATLDDWDFLLEYYAGNPLMLKLIAIHAKELFGCDISQLLEIESHQISVLRDLRNLLDRQFNHLSDLEKQIMYELALSKLPVPISDLQKRTCLSSSANCFIEALRGLIQRSLVEKSNSGFKLEPIIIDYVNYRMDNPEN
ncbi:MAG: NB-ARC domain-containing protein [Cyanobacteria bacterium P01_A01_bin.68]